ncbi:MAG: O-antigen ligase family protein [Burkholderiales bacterium]|nr:O-antigen ligase family protein [Burkholderiales bacterium]
MSLAQLRERIPLVNSWLLAAVFFCIPVQVAPAYLLSAAMLLLWLIEGDLRRKLRELAGEPLVWIVLGCYGVLLLSLLWSDDRGWGWQIMQRHRFFLLFPLYYSVARREHFGRYVGAFLASIALCEALAFYNWARLHYWPGLPEGIRVEKSPDDTAPFVDRIFYTPALALAGYLAGHRLLFDAQTPGRRLVYGGLLATTTLNLLIAGGRAGMVGFLVLLALLAFQRFARRPVVAGSAAAALVAVVLVGGYHGSSYFRSRVDDAVDTYVHYRERPDSSVSLRLVYAMNALRVYAAHPLLGVGVGDYPKEYERVNATHTPQWTPAWNPHNHYLLVLTAAGLPGGIALALVLGYPLRRRAPADGRERIRRAVPVLMITICLFESYLLRSNVSMMYMLFTAALWRDASGAGPAQAAGRPPPAADRVTQGGAREARRRGLATRAAMPSSR